MKTLKVWEGGGSALSVNDKWLETEISQIRLTGIFLQEPKCVVTKIAVRQFSK